MEAARNQRTARYALTRRRLLGQLGIAALGVAAACNSAPAPAPNKASPSTPVATAPPAASPASKPAAATAPTSVAAKPTAPPARRAYQPATVKLGYSTSPRVDTARRVGERQGFFQDFGITLDVVQITATVDIVRAALSEEITFGSLDLPTVLAAIDGGSPIKVLATYEAKLGHIIFARPEIKSLKDLEGKSVGITGVGGLPDVITRLALRQAGADASKIEFVSLQGSVGIYRAIVANKVMAGAATDAFLGSAQRDGVVPLVKTWEALPNYVSSTFVTTDEGIQKHHDEIVRTLAGFVKTFRYIAEPASKSVWLDVAMSEVEQDREQAEAAWQGVAESTPYRADPTIVKAQFDYMQEVNVGLARQKSVFPFERVVDVSLIKEAMALL